MAMLMTKIQTERNWSGEAAACISVPQECWDMMHINRKSVGDRPQQLIRPIVHCCKPPAMAMAVRAVTALFLVQCLVRLAQASLPPVQCDDTGCTVVNAYRVWLDRKDCRFAQVFYPTTEKELVAAVATAVRTKKKLRVVSKWAHSIPKLVCPAGDDGILISTRDYNRTVHVDHKAGTATVDAGVQLKDLVEILAQKGVAFPNVPYWSGLSIAGLLSTGAHGSSLFGKGGAAHEYITRIRIVVPAPASKGYATVKTFSAANPAEFAAAKVSLGVLGAISQITLQVEPQFKRSVTHDLTSDDDLASKLVFTGKTQEFGDARWYASQGQVLYRADNRVPISTPGDGIYDLFRPGSPESILATRAATLVPETTRNAPGLCAGAQSAIQASALRGFSAANDKTSGLFDQYPVVGFNHLISTSRGECTEGIVDFSNLTNPINQPCVLFDLGADHGNFVYDVAVSIPLTKLPAAVADIKKLVKQRPYGLCPTDLVFGLLFRFVKGKSSAFLGISDDSVDIDLIFLRADDAETPRLNNDVLDEVEQLLLFKYAGKPHWGKNRPLGFIGVGAKYPHLKDFLKVKKKLDPQGFFSNEWTDAVLGVRGKVTQVKPYCALEGLCICSEDAHCAPEKGYYCRQGLVYKEARVCRYLGRQADE